MKYAHIDENNELLGWYDSEIHAVIPTPNVEVTEEQWQNAINSGHNKVNQDGTTELFDFRTDEEKAIEIKAEIEQAIQKMLDDKAKELRYDNMMSARSYAGFDNPFQREAQALAAWCANCWLVAGQMEASGEVYTVEEVLAQMPTYGA